MQEEYFVDFDFANYSHVFLYVVYYQFEQKMRELGKIGKIDYALDASIDGNVISWKIYSSSHFIRQVFQGVLEYPIISDARVIQAINLISLQLEKRPIIHHLVALEKILAKPQISKIKPAFITNDDLTSPAIDFTKSFHPFISYIKFQLDSTYQPTQVYQYYLLAIAQQLSLLLPDDLVSNDLDNFAIEVRSLNRIKSLDDEISRSISNFKQLYFDRKISKFLNLPLEQIRNDLRVIKLVADCENY